MQSNNTNKIALDNYLTVLAINVALITNTNKQLITLFNSTSFFSQSTNNAVVFVRANYEEIPKPLKNIHLNNEIQAVNPAENRMGQVSSKTSR